MDTRITWTPAARYAPTSRSNRCDSPGATCALKVPRVTSTGFPLSFFTSIFCGEVTRMHRGWGVSGMSVMTAGLSDASLQAPAAGCDASAGTNVADAVADGVADESSSPHAAPAQRQAAARTIGRNLRYRERRLMGPPIRRQLSLGRVSRAGAAQP